MSEKIRLPEGTKIIMPKNSKFGEVIKIEKLGEAVLFVNRMKWMMK